MPKINKIITVVAIIILASLGWYFFVQKTILKQNVTQDANRADPGFRRIAAGLIQEPEPTPPPLLYLVRPDTSENYTDPSSSGDTFDIKLTSRLPAAKNGVPYKLAGGEIFAVRIIATPKSKGLISNFLHLEELRIPIRFDNRDIEPVTITDANGMVKLDETGLSEECSFYQLFEPRQTNLSTIGSLSSFYYDKRFPRDVPTSADPTGRFARYTNVSDKGIQLQENTCIGEIKFRVKQKLGSENLANPEALVKIANLEREIGPNARGPAGTDPVDPQFLLGDIGINEHLNWKISNGQTLGSFAIGYRLLSEQPTPTATPTLVPASYCAGVTQIPELECLALVAIFTNANGRLQNADGWLKDNTPCSWDGINCATGADNMRHVVKIDFSNFSIKLIGAKIPTQIKDLTYLTDIVLNGHGITGPIPESIGLLEKLIVLKLNNNLLNESLPMSIGGLTKLTSLEVQDNRLEGLGSGDPSLKNAVCGLLTELNPDWWQTQNNITLDPCSNIVAASPYTPTDTPIPTEDPFTTMAVSTPTNTPTPTTEPYTDLTAIIKEEINTGGTYDIRVWVSNNGNKAVPSSQNIITHLYIDPVDSPPNSLTAHTTTDVWNFGLAGGEYTYSFTQSNVTLSPGEHTIYAWIDRDNAIDEGPNNKGNNLVAYSFVVSSPAACVKNLNYWKTNHDSWPVASLAIGGVTYNEQGLLGLLNSENSDLTYVLAKNLIVTKLNIANGTDPSSIINTTVNSADSWLVIYPITGAPPSPTSDAYSTGNSHATALFEYNKPKAVGICATTMKNNGIVAKSNTTSPTRQRVIAKTMDVAGASVLGVNTGMKLVAASDFTLPTPTGFFVDWQEPAWSLLWIDKVGSHRYSVPVDYDTKPAVDPMSPDLVMTTMKLYRDPNPPNPDVLDCSVKLEITIKNIGTADAGAFTVKANDRTYKVTEGIPMGAEKTLRFDHYTHGFNYGPNIVQLDIEDEVFELREDNNIAERYLFLGGFITSECPISAYEPDWITPIPSISPTVNPSGSPSGSPAQSPTPTTPADISGVPVDMTKVNIQLKVRLQGVRSETFSNQYSHLKIGVKIGQTGTKTSTDFVYGDFVRVSGAIYEGIVTFDSQKVPTSSNYKISVKGPKHIAKRFCVSTPTGADAYYCASTAGSISLKPGIQTFDFSSVGLAPGDLPIGGAQDVVVDSNDLAYIRNNLGKKTAEVLKTGDLNLDGIVDTQDFSIVVNSLINNEDEL